MTTSAPYERTLGHLDTDTLTVVDVDRDDYLRIVDEAIAEIQHDDWTFDPDVVAQLRETARTMTHFPLGTWLNSSRGCGCLIGEYLVAATTMDRAEYVDHFWQSMVTVRDAISAQAGRGQAFALERLGLLMDERITELAQIVDAVPTVDAVWIVD